jgi:hypothetical protein
VLFAWGVPFLSLQQVAAAVGASVAWRG